MKQRVMKFELSIKRFCDEFEAWLSYQFAQDLCNQIKWSQPYKEDCVKVGKDPAAGKFLSPTAGEWFSGLPKGWTEAKAGAVNDQAFDAAFPESRKARAPAPVASN